MEPAFAFDQVRTPRDGSDEGDGMKEEDDVEKSGIGELPVEYDGEPLEIGFNAQYLLELLRYMPTDEVRMSFKAPERAATMMPLGNEDTPDYLCLVMPLRLLS